jgi:NADPH:quinone reductase
MRAMVVNAFGGPEVLTPEERPDPRPGPGEVLVGVEAVGVNFMDVVHRRGGFGAQAPFVPGAEGAGTVLMAGEGVSAWRLGDRVAWRTVRGSYADRILAPAEALVAVPADLPLDTAAAVLLQGMTAQSLVAVASPFLPDDWALVHAAAGGVGLLLVQLLKAARVRVVGTVSSEAKARPAREAGADAVVVYADGSFADAVRRVSGDGVAVVYDSVGRATLAESLQAVRPGGRVVTYGAASGPAEPLRLGDLPSGVFAGSYGVGTHYDTPERNRAGAAKLFTAVLAGRLAVTVAGRYPLSEVGRAHAELESRTSVGKFIVLP